MIHARLCLNAKKYVVKCSISGFSYDRIVGIVILYSGC